MNRWIAAMLGWLCITGGAIAAPQGSTEKENLLQDQKYLQSVYRYLIAEVAKQRGQPGLSIPLYAQLLKDYPNPLIARQGVEAAIRAGRYGNALEFVSIWNHLDKEDPIAQDWLISLIFKSPNPLQYRAQLENILKDNPDKAGAIWITLAARASEATQKTVSATMLDEMADGYPSLAEAWWAKAYAAEARGDDESVITHLKHAIQLKPDWEPAFIQYARLSAKQDMKTGITLLEGFVNKYPNATEARLAYARLLVTDRQFAKAKGAFEIAQRQKPDNPDISYAIGILSLQSGDLAKAEASLQQSLDLDYSDQDAVYLLLGEIEEKKNQPENAIAYYLQVTGSSFAGAQLRVADILDGKKEYNRAIDLLDKAIEQQPAMQKQFSDAKLILLKHAHRLDDAYQLVSQRIGTDKKNPDLYYERAMLADQLGNSKQLETDLKEAIALEPKHARSLNALGYTMADQLGKAEEGLPLIEQALALEPDNPAYIDSLGWAQYRLGRLTEAEANLHKAYEMEDDAEIAAHYGEVLWVNGKKEDARKIWKASQQKSPDRTEVAETIKRLNAN